MYIFYTSLDEIFLETRWKQNKTKQIIYIYIYVYINVFFCV